MTDLVEQAKANLVELTIPRPTDDVSLGAATELDWAKTFVITSADDYKLAANRRAQAKGNWNKVDETRKKLVKPINDAHDSVQALFNPHLANWKAIETALRNSMNVYDTEQARLAHQAEVQRQIELKRLADEAEAQRVAAAEAEDRASEAAATGDDDAALMAQIEARTAQITAERTQKQADIVESAPLPVAEPTRVAGVARVTVWKYRVTDLSKVDRKFLVLDESAVQKVVTALKDKAQSMIGAGIEVYSEFDTRSRAK